MCFFLGGICSSVVALQTNLASRSPARLCLAAVTRSTRLWPATFGLCRNLFIFIAKKSGKGAKCDSDTFSDQIYYSGEINWLLNRSIRLTTGHAHVSNFRKQHRIDRRQLNSTGPEPPTALLLVCVLVSIGEFSCPLWLKHHPCITQRNTEVPVGDKSEPGSELLDMNDNWQLLLLVFSAQTSQRHQVLSHWRQVSLSRLSCAFSFSFA